MTTEIPDQSHEPPEVLELGLAPLSRVHLDELLHELLDRVGDVLASRERLRPLLDAVVGMSADLDLRSTLERIVVSACRLVGARYGALGVVGEDRRLVEFITHGIGPAELQDAARPSMRRSAIYPPAGGCSACSSRTRGRFGCPISPSTRSRTDSPRTIPRCTPS